MDVHLSKRDRAQLEKEAERQEADDRRWRTLLLDQTSAPAVATQKQLQNVRRDKSA